MANKTAGKNKAIILIEKYGLYVLLGIIAVIVGIVFYDFIIFEKLYLFKGHASDSLNDTYPNYILIADYLRSEGMPMWSFRQGMGQSIFPFSFPDPFVSFLYILGRDHLAFGLAYMEILKIFLAGTFFYLYLKKLSLSQYTAVTGGLLYAFSGFLIIGSCWNLFSSEVLYLSFLLYAYEKLYQDKNRYLFPIAIALIAILQPFDLWLFGIFLFIYMLFRHLEENETGSYKKFLITLSEVAVLGILGIGISSFLFLSEVRMLLNSPRVGGDVGFFNELMSKPVFGFEDASHYLTAIMRLFSSELLGPSNNFNGWHNYLEAPILYCGLVTLLLFPQVFLFLDRRKKIIYSLLLAVYVVSIIFPFFRYAFWLFTGDYYRLYSFFLSFVLILFSVKALHNITISGKMNATVLAITVLVLFATLYYPYDYLKNKSILDEDLRITVSVFLVIYSILIYLLKHEKTRDHISLILLLAVITELTYFSAINVNERLAQKGVELKQKTGYLDYSIDAIDYLNKIDNSYFRVSKDYFSGPSIHSSLNDAKIQAYNGTASYHSFNQKHYVRFLSQVELLDGSDENETRWLMGLRNAPILHSFAGIKYFLSKNPENIQFFTYDLMTQIGDVKIYKNLYALPLGFTYEKYISTEKFNTLSTLQQVNNLHKAVVINDSLYFDYIKTFPVFPRRDTSEFYTQEEYAEDIMLLKKDTLVMKKFSQNNIKGTVSLDERKLLFFSIPFSEGWSAKVDGKAAPLIRVNIGFTGLFTDKGNHTVELTFIPPYYYIGMVISIISILIYIGMIVVLKQREHKQSIV